MRSKILITGADGMLGHACSQYFPDAICATRADADLRNLSSTESLFRSVKPERVIHCAALVGGVKANAARNADFLTENSQINSNVLSVAAESGVKKLVSFLSSCTYKIYDDKPSTEDDVQSGEPFEGNLGYSTAKRALDIQSRLVSKQYGVDFCTLTPVTMFGPHDHYDLENSHVLGALIHKCHAAKQNGTAFEVWGSGRAVRQFVYVKDTARFISENWEGLSAEQTLILAADEGMSIRQLAEAIAAEMNFKGEIKFDTSKPEGQLKRVLKSKRFENAYAGFRFTPFREALKETITWFLASLESGLIRGGNAA